MRVDRYFCDNCTKDLSDGKTGGHCQHLMIDVDKFSGGLMTPPLSSSNKWKEDTLFVNTINHFCNTECLKLYLDKRIEAIQTK